jgi:predicted Rossmann fold nucleotide-binding protein DprA/Smf involved in DNA uptake
MTRTLSRPELLAWVRLARTPRIGPLTFHRLIARFGAANAALEALPRVSKLVNEVRAVDALKTSVMVRGAAIGIRGFSAWISRRRTCT